MVNGMVLTPFAHSGNNAMSHAATDHSADLLLGSLGLTQQYNGTFAVPS